MTKFPTFIDFSMRRLFHESLHAKYSAKPVNKNFILHTEKLPPCTGQILSTCAVLQEASAPDQFECAHSGHKNQGKQTVLK